MSQKADFPWYFTIDDRPVKIIAAPGGGMDVLVANLTTGKLERDMQYLAYCFEPGKNVQRLSEAEFKTCLKALREALSDRADST